MRTAVVGGGILGLTLALRLAQAGDEVTVYESAPSLGGLAAAWRLGDVTWDRHYHVTLLSDAATRGLAAELGLGDAYAWATTKTGFYVDGRMHGMSTTLEFALFPPLGPLSKARLAATILRAARPDPAQALAHVPVGAWLRRWSGRRTYAKIWLPLLRAKLGEAHERVAASFIRATVARMYAARRSGLKRELFGYVRGGYAALLERFAAVLAERGVTVRTGARVRAVEPAAGGGWRVRLANDASGGSAPRGGSWLRDEGKDDSAPRFDRVVVTAAPPLAARMLPALGPAERERLAAVEYQGIVCASLLLSRPLSPYYVTNIADPAPFTAVIETTALVDPAAFGGRHLVYLPKYCAPDDPLLQLDDAAIRARFVAGLRALHPGLRDEEILAFRVSRAPYVFALPTLGYVDRIPSLRTSLPGLYLVNGSQIVDGTLNVDETVRLAERAAREILAEHAAGENLVPPAAAAVTPERLTVPTPPYASLSLDLDDKWSYLKTRGDAAWQDHPSYLATVVPRALDLLARRGLRITWFIVGQDAAFERNHAVLRSIADAGHEIGNHSFHHEPWLHLYGETALDDEIGRAERAIATATGVVPRGFRGPGYSVTPAVVDTLVRRGYAYDASTLPTFIGPLARAYYFATSGLRGDERKQRDALFGSVRDGLRPLKPYRWRSAHGSLVEVPVTTMPGPRVPIHFSYVLFLAQLAPALVMPYAEAALRACLLSRTAPSLLLHPLDFLDGADAPELAFFPAMRLRAEDKLRWLERVLDRYAAHYDFVTVGEHAARAEAALPHTARALA